MAIKQSTAEKIQVVIGNSTDVACIGGYYNMWFKETCICGHGIKEVYIIGHANDHGPAYNQPTFRMGSECFKFLNQDPRFRALSADLQAKRQEIQKIQRMMKKAREDEFHATPEWKAMAEKLGPLSTMMYILRAPVAGHLNFVKRANLSLDFHGVLGAEAISKKITAIYYGDLRFQDLESAEAVFAQAERIINDGVEMLRPHRAEIEAFLATSFRGIPGHDGFKTLLERM